jgi:hypothetical protein
VSEDDDQSRIETYRENLKHSLKARFVLRFHVGMIIGAALLVAWIVDVVLLRAGFPMTLRYPVSVLLGYGMFILGVMLWLQYSGIREYLNEREAERMLQEGERIKRGQSRKSDSSSWDIPDFGFPAADAEGCAVVLLVLVAGGLLFWGLGIFAGQLFAEVVLEIILAAGLVRGLRRSESSGWMIGIWKSTRVPLVVILILLTGFAAWAQANSPTAKTFAEVMALR